MVYYGYPEIGREEDNGSAEFRRSHAKDRERMLIQLNRPPHHAAIIVKVSVPIGVAEHDKRSAVWPTIIGVMEKPAKIRPNSQHVKVVRSCLHVPFNRWTFPRIDRHLTHSEPC